MIDAVHEKCGIAGVMAPKGEDAAPIAAKVASGLQHRGQEGGGMYTQTFDGVSSLYKDSQRFGQIFPSKRSLEKHNLKGEIALAHTRYRTTGSAKDVLYAQPVKVGQEGHFLVGAHNGNIANFLELIGDLPNGERSLKTGGRKTPPLDSEVALNRMFYAPGGSWPDKIARGIEGMEGAFSLVLATDQNEMIALRDPWGIRPLSFGRIDGHFVVASETNVLDKIGAVDQKEISKGEMWIFREKRDPEQFIYNSSQPKKFCDFEKWYFQWPSSRINGVESEIFREQCGRELALEERRRGVCPADLVVGVPDTGRSSAITFAEELGLPYRDRIYKARYDEQVKRSFIGSDQETIVRILDDKYYLSRSLEGLEIYLVDDSGIRLNTTRILVKALKEGVGVAKVHIRFASPLFIRPCVLGVNINRREELGAVKLENGLWVVKEYEEMATETGADSVGFLSMGGRINSIRSFNESPDDFCGYCHGAEGPPFNFLKYDSAKLLERSRAVLTI